MAFSDPQPWMGEAVGREPVAVIAPRTRGIHGYHVLMAVAVRKLDVSVGDVVQVGERRYDVVPDTDGSVALEPAITKTVDELHVERGGRPLTADEFDEYFGHLPTDDEG